MIKHINITEKDIVKVMSEENKHTLAIKCILNETEPADVIKPLCNVLNATYNFAVDVCNSYLESPVGKEYLNMRKKIDRLGE